MPRGAYSAATSLEDPLPQAMGVRQGVGFIDHADAWWPGLSGLLVGRGRGGHGERGAHDALDAAARIEVFRDGDLVFRPALKRPAHLHVRSLGVLAQHDKVDVLCGSCL